MEKDSKGFNGIACAATLAITLTAGAAGVAQADATSDQQVVAALDTAFQAAVERNDADAMAAILHDDFTLVVGSGASYQKSDLLQAARERQFAFENQVEIDQSQKVRVFADTAIVTAKLWLKGRTLNDPTRDPGLPFDYVVWFSDTYVRTPQGWKYYFGQASLPSKVTVPLPPRRQPAQP